MKRYRVLTCFVIFSMVLVINANHAAAQGSKKDESIRKGETRATLAPNMFTDPQIKKAYQVAKEIPWVLDSIYCYCMCEESPVFKHKSLLSCYVNNHAAM